VYGQPVPLLPLHLATNYDCAANTLLYPPPPTTASYDAYQQTFAASAKVGVATVFGIVPFVAFNKILAPKMGLVDETAPTEFKDGEEPWR